MQTVSVQSAAHPIQRFLLSLIEPHPSFQSPVVRRQAQLNAALSLLFAVITLVSLGVSVLITGTWNVIYTVALGFGGISFAAYLLSRSTALRFAPFVLLTGFLILAYVASFTGQYPALFLSLTFSLLFLLTNLLPLGWMVGVILGNTLLVFLLGRLFLPNLTGIEALNAFSGIFTFGLFVILFAWYRDSLEQLRLDELRQAQNAVEERNRELQRAQTILQKRFDEIQLAAEVGRAVSQVRALDDLLADAVERIRARFDLYYVQVYLLNPARTHLVLEAGSGEVGATLRARKHQLLFNTSSINGRAALEKKPVVIPDTSASSFFRPNPLLPKTRAEVAVPLLLGERVVGVLDIQSERPGSLTEEMLPAFEALAGQLAVAIQNAQLLAQAEQARAEVEAYARRLERRGWQEYLDGIHLPEQIGYRFEQGQVLSLEGDAASPENALTAPISISGEPIGVLTVELDETGHSPLATELLNAVARQVAEHLETLRLLELTERYRVQSEQAIRRLTREGWQEYLQVRQAESLGYLYDARAVVPLEAVSSIQAETALTVPVRVRDETVGKITVLDADPEDPETLEIVHLVTERLSEHIETLRLLEETRRGQAELDRRARQLAAVSEITTLSSRETDVNRMLEIVVHLTQRKFGLYHAHIFTYNPVNRQLLIVACGWREGDEHEGTHGTTTIAIDQEQSLVARAARTRQPVLVNDVRSDPGWLPNPLLPETRAELAVPLLVGDEVLGVLDVQSERINAFSEEDVNIQVTLAAQVATALQNARNYERARRQAEREALLNAISQKIQSATSVEAVLQIAARELGHALRAPRAIAQLSLKDS